MINNGDQCPNFGTPVNVTWWRRARRIAWFPVLLVGTIAFNQPGWISEERAAKLDTFKMKCRQCAEPVTVALSSFKHPSR